MKASNVCTLLLFLFVSVGLYAQQIVKGTVKDAATGDPLPGVSVLVKGTTHGTATDFDGMYELKAEKGQTLVFSYIGFKTQEVLVKTENQTVNVNLQEDTQQLDDVVVIGYGVAKKKDVTGSVNLVTTKDFNKGQNLSAGDLLQGKVAGVQITSGGGAPGDGQNIRVRGTGSLTLNSNPLVVVDGVPMNDGAIGGARNILNDINPDDIESMTVLKDASSTAIYGSRAANGVIMITTKKGKVNQETQVVLNSSISIAEVSDYVNVLSAGEFRKLVNETGTDTQKAILGNASTNWQKEIYQLAPTSNTTVGISGNLASIPYRLSLGHTYADGVLRTDKFQRGTAKLSLTPRFFDNSLKTELNVSGSYVKNRFAERGAIGSAIEFDPTQSVRTNSDKYDGYFSWLDASSGSQSNTAPVNPMALLNLRNNTADVKRLISNLKVDYTLPFFKDITATVNAGVDITESNGKDITDPKMPNSSTDFNGVTTIYGNKAVNMLFDAYANYVKDLGKHSISFMAGHSYQKFEFTNDSNQTQFFKGKDNLVIPVIDKSRNVLLSFFGRANYSFDNRYMLTATLRADASSKLNPDDRWGYFPSVALAWNAKNESFLKESENVNELKLRLGYGEVGNVNGLGDYLFLTRYVGSINQGAYYQFGNQFVPTARPESLNKNLRWEIGNTLNAGIDYGFWQNRVSGSIDVYRKLTKDLIAESNVAPFTNYGSRISSNIGDMENKGIEFLVNVVPVRTDDVNWTLSYNIAYNDNKITRLTNLQNVGGISGGTGNTVQRHQEGYAPYTFFLYQQVYDNKGFPIEGAYVDRNNDGKITEDDRYMGKSPYADVTMGLTTNLNYKNWDLNIATRASLGNYVYDNVSSANASLDRVYSDNILRNTIATYYDTLLSKRTTETLLSDMYLHDGSFFKIDNVTLGYNFPKDKYGIRIYGTVQNVLTLSKYKGLDPEVVTLDGFGRPTFGVDNNVYPRPRTYLLGINVNF
ncbi:TonB-dependent receptor SusC [Capnocytophaga felis]|uniref:SusC/RagA family TonB-linked outer membrane protein n=1 Tax=Capnocytophaga felis TaxID=2267611 RepID=UPI0012CD8F57|nr:TonB-dependent receptor [Capnocytophaga felis]GET47237.1 TonB-dependent receptor SusC [Capnocytophaga felis]